MSVYSYLNIFRPSRLSANSRGHAIYNMIALSNEHFSYKVRIRLPVEVVYAFSAMASAVSCDPFLVCVATMEWNYG
jgi:hypothetical protein